MMTRARRDSGFTLIEVVIAMTILAIGATSILAIFVTAVSFQTKRMEDNRITELYNYARYHAQEAFNAFDPASAKDGQALVPGKIVADLSDRKAVMESGDQLIIDALSRFPGFKYEIDFEESELAVQGSSVVADIKIYRLSGQRDETLTWSKEFLSRSGTPVREFFRSPSLELLTKDERRRKQEGRDRGG